MDQPENVRCICEREPVHEPLCRIARSLQQLHTKVDKIMTAQDEYSTDLTALQAFFADLATQLTAIQGQLADRGVTDVTGLDALVQQAQQLQPTVDALGAPPAAPAPAPAPAPSE